MSGLNKIDFAIVMRVDKALPNGDPANNNMPREDFQGYGLMTDGCIKRKIRNTLSDMGYPIFEQSDDRKLDKYNSLSERFKEEIPAEVKTSMDDTIRAICEKWFDVRAFGTVCAFKVDGESVSTNVKGAVTFRIARSIEPIDVIPLQITKSFNGESVAKGKSSDTMGMKYMVDDNVYISYGSISVNQANKNGFTEADAETLKEAILYMFANDASAARPSGSMEVVNLVWWKHNCPAGNLPSAKVHRSLSVKREGNDYKIEVKELENITCEILEGRS